jgi:superfamily II DNA helicase RecQ
MTVAAKWMGVMGSMTAEQLHAQPFLERVTRSAAYFHKTMMDVLQKLLKETSVTTDNKAHQKRFDEALADLIMAYEMKRRTLLMIHNEGFSTANYLHFKAKAALEAIEESSGKQKRKGKRQINKSDIRYPELYKRLIVWREKKATMYETNANNIIQYRALLNIVNEVPTTLPSLMAVQYVGRTTVKKYGMDILEIVNTFVNQNRDNLS